MRRGGGGEGERAEAVSCANNTMTIITLLIYLPRLCVYVRRRGGLTCEMMLVGTPLFCSW